MPIYEFLCQNCGHVFEKLCFSRKEAEEVHCPSCKGTKVSKLFSPFAKRASGLERLASSCGPGGKGGFS